jgi:hypothetical protein
MEEIWKDIIEYEGSYQVSNLGRVKSLLKFRGNRNGGYFQKERILKPGKYKTGYSYVILYQNKVTKVFKIHRLVAQAFILNPENKREVNHINGIKFHNQLENLEWCTPSENRIHAYKTKLRRSNEGEQNNNVKLTQIQVDEIRQKYIPRKHSIYKLAKEYNISSSQIFVIVNHKSWK